MVASASLPTNNHRQISTSDHRTRSSTPLFFRFRTQKKDPFERLISTALLRTVDRLLLPDGLA
ncbi:hypothetical protein SDJN02_10213, partial [Cucurbita argyrosperma subsp. argyrosperma]